MGPQNQIILDDDVLEAVKQRAAAEGKTLDQATNDVVRLGLSEARGQSVVKRERDYGREMRGAVRRRSHTGRRRCRARVARGTARPLSETGGTSSGKNEQGPTATLAFTATLAI